MDYSSLYLLPVWAIGLVVLVVLLAAVEIGFRVGLSRRDFWKDADSGGGAVVLTSLFAVLGLVLAFTYASSVSRFDARKQGVIVEANALGTAFLRADAVAEPGRSALKKAIFEYALTRVMPPGSATSEEKRIAVISRTLEKQANLWPATLQVIAQQNPDPMEASVVAAINEVLDAHTIRLAAFSDTLPIVIMWLLLLVAAAALTVAGYNAGLQGLISRWRMSALTMVLTGIMLVILDLDRPTDGTVTVSQESIIAAIAEMDKHLRR